MFAGLKTFARVLPVCVLDELFLLMVPPCWWDLQVVPHACASVPTTMCSQGKVGHMPRVVLLLSLFYS